MAKKCTTNIFWKCRAVPEYCLKRDLDLLRLTVIFLWFWASCWAASPILKEFHLWKTAFWVPLILMTIVDICLAYWQADWVHGRLHMLGNRSLGLLVLENHQLVLISLQRLNCNLSPDIGGFYPRITLSWVWSRVFCAQTLNLFPLHPNKFIRQIKYVTCDRRVISNHAIRQTSMYWNADRPHPRCYPYMPPWLQTSRQTP